MNDKENTLMKDFTINEWINISNYNNLTALMIIIIRNKEWMISMNEQEET